MNEVLLGVAGVYFFVALGFAAQASFKNLDEKTLVTLSIYFLQPLLAFWGLSAAPITLTLFEAALFYLAVTLIALAVSLAIARLFFVRPHDRSIATVAALIGNTGNLGIPLGIALFGEGSVLYTTLINLVNVFFVYTLGVFFYSLGSFSIKESLLNILRLPVLWLAGVAVWMNLEGFALPQSIERTLQMGAYASMVIQLLIFGIYLYSIRPNPAGLKLSAIVTANKFVLIPGLGFALLLVWPLPPELAAIVLLQLAVPLAVANVNLAALYGCSPARVTESVLLTSLLFLFYLPAFILLLQFWGFMTL
ncbi:MAG: AEC family transporter [Campylobacterales bacterium]